MSGATNGTSTCRQMRVLAKTDRLVAARIDLFDHRVPEEAYEVRYDPDALTNLISSPRHAAEVAQLEKALEDWMVRTRDPLLEVFRRRDDDAFREQYMQQLEGRQVSRKARKAANNEMKKTSSVTPKTRPENLISLETPTNITAGQKAVVKLTHKLPPEQGEKAVQVTLKGADNERIERKEVIVSGTGVVEVAFDIPAGLAGKKVLFAGLVGKSIKDALQHLQTKPQAVK
jgi:N-sulfoglucosamine sulfohydrolase